MDKLYVEEAVSQITGLQDELIRIKGLLEKITGEHLYCKRCLLYVFTFNGKCPRCGDDIK